MINPQGITDIGLINFYEENGSDTTRIVYCSGRLKVGNGNEVGIFSFAVSGSGRRRVILKTNGPSLASNPDISSPALSNPKLSLYEGSSFSNLLDTNGDWEDYDGNGSHNPFEDELDGRGIVLLDSSDSVLWANLFAGIYTVLLEIESGSSGLCVLEVTEYR
ncbi:hypothetical protein MLD52_19640 [Puniceicoccaceae bacterium K14]|nr:hypothetical protein [Puniceicoccaceae bacterium K14]